MIILAPDVTTSSIAKQWQSKGFRVNFAGSTSLQEAPPPLSSRLQFPLYQQRVRAIRD